MNKRFIKIVVCMCMSLIIALTPLLSLAESPNKTYTHQVGVDGNKKTVYSRDIYSASENINASTLNTQKLTGITDIFCTDEGNIYLLCGDDSRLVLLDKDYKFVKNIEIHDGEGKKCKYKGAKGIFVNKKGEIYIADTNNSRIIIANSDGLITRELESPKSDIIPDDFFFQPTKVLEDDQGYLYVLSLGCYYGLLLYSDKYEFLGFYGANEVETTILSTIANIWEVLTSNDEKKSKQIKVLPYTNVDVVFDSEGYVYTCTGRGKTDSVETGQIKKMSPGGTNILYSRSLDGTASSSSSFNFLESKIIRRGGNNRVQNIVSIEVGDSGHIYALDATYGKIYVYDEDCMLVSVLGGGVGKGNKLGTFVDATALTVKGTDVLVADAGTGLITVFKLTDFGKTLFKAQGLYFDSKYSEAKGLWEEILAQDGNCRFAYSGLAKAYYAEGDNEKALKYAKLGLDYDIYDSLHQENIDNFIRKYFVLIFVLAVLIIALVAFILIKIRKREKSMIKNDKLRCFASVLVHPFQAFDDVKYKGIGSLRIATVMTLLFFLTETLRDISCGFLFNKSDVGSYNVLFTIARTIGLIALWSVANWAICSVMEGKGKLKEIYIVTAYALLPVVIYNALYVIISHFITLEGMDMLVGLQAVILVYVFFVLSVGIMAIHEYNFPRFLVTSVFAILIMILIVFIGFMVVILVQQFWNFIYSLFMEAMYR